jgi:uncharacterized protein (TIGR02271 family)
MSGQHEHGTPSDESGATMELREEELRARKESVESGRVRMDKDIVEEQRTLEVPVMREEITLDRHAVERRPADGGIGDAQQAISVPLHQEHVTAEKRTVVYEEVGISKHAVEDTERVSDTVHKEVMDVDTEGDVRLRGDRA